MQRAQLTEFVSKLDREDWSLRSRVTFVERKPLVVAAGDSKKSRRLAWRNVICCSLATLLLVALIAFAWMRPDFNRAIAPDWKPVAAAAEAALSMGDLYSAKSLYLQAGRYATWHDDWAGLLAAGCGISRIAEDRGPYSATNALLLRATAIAERQQDPSGIAAIASAFAALDEGQLASMTWSRLPNRRIERTDEAADWVAAGCFAN